MKTHTREEWLQRAAEMLIAGPFWDAGYEVPETHISTGWPSGTKKNGEGKTIGQCWFGEQSSDGRCHIFITPMLDDVVMVVATLAHELVHAAVGHEAKHGKVFKRCAVAIGLEGKMTATYAGEKLALWIQTELPAVIGYYPHAKLTPGGGLKKQTTRMIKCQCQSCGYVARTTAKWLADVGAPLCACNSEPMEAA